MIAIFVTVFLIWGIKCLFTEPFFLYKVGDKVEGWIGNTACKPLFRCPPCMASVWGTVMYFLLVNQGLLNWVIFVIAVCGVNFILKEFLYD